MPKQSPTSASDLLSLLQQSRLVSEHRLQSFLDRITLAPTTADDLARQLVDANVITLYQAKHLLKGNNRGLVVDHFEIRDFLGKGGMGSVYLAWDRRDDRPCALKVLLPSKRREPRNLLRFQREIEVSLRLSHPGLAKAYSAGVAGGVHYLALEYVAGLTLYRWTRARGPASSYWAARWFGTVARALEHTHQAGVIHRDLKPSNVIIRHDGNAKLLDLGLARWYSDDHNELRVIGERRILGSFDYIAPEQAADSTRADGRSDVYSLGCVLYFAMTGRPPFHDATETRHKIHSHKTRDPEPIERLRPDLRSGFALAVDRMMAKNPRDRYQSCAEVADIMDYWEDRLRSAESLDLSLFAPLEESPPATRPSTANG